MRDNKKHPAETSRTVSRGECTECGNVATLTIFRQQGLCHRCKTQKDVEVVKRVADNSGTRSGLRAERLEMHSFGPSHHGLGTITAVSPQGIDWEEERIPIEEVVWCTNCGRHVVAEVGQTCPHCERSR